MLLAVFGIEDGNINLAVNLLLLFLVVVWLALVWWTFADARRRIEDPVLVGVATIASLFPFVGSLVYSILRPPEFLVDKRERELDTKAAELRLRQLKDTSCPRCEHPVERSWLRCPECQSHLKDPCSSCSRPVDPDWTMCPYCESPLKPAAPAPSERRGSRPPRRSTSAKAATKSTKTAASKPTPVRKPRGSSSRSRPEETEQLSRTDSDSDGNGEPTAPTRSRSRGTRTDG